MITTIFHCKSDPLRRVLIPQGAVVSSLPQDVQSDVIEPGTDVTYDELVPPESFRLKDAEAALREVGYFSFQEHLAA